MAPTRPTGAPVADHKFFHTRTIREGSPDAVVAARVAAALLLCAGLTNCLAVALIVARAQHLVERLIMFAEQ